jgi:hypothetical protein
MLTSSLPGRCRLQGVCGEASAWEGRKCHDLSDNAGRPPQELAKLAEHRRGNSKKIIKLLNVGLTSR